MKRGYNISGLQQIGLGVTNVKEAWAWYHKYLCFDIKIFEEAGIAEHMLPYTGGQPQQRHAILPINLNGGGGFEIWQFTRRTPQKPATEVRWGDRGILAAKIKSYDIDAIYRWYADEGIDLISKILEMDGRRSFYFRDPFQNIFQVVESDEWFQKKGKPIGGVCGAFMGVSDINAAKIFYNAVLGYNKIVYDKIDTFDDFKGLPGGERKVRRVLLTHNNLRKGYFSPIYGSSELELIHVLDEKTPQIYNNRYWGDPGFMHLCYEVTGIDSLRETCKEYNFPFTVDVGKHFDMGEAAGTFAYNEDPDGTLVEYVEAYKVPISKKLNVYLNLKKRDPLKPLPKTLLKALKYNRVKKVL